MVTEALLSGKFRKTLFSAWRLRWELILHTHRQMYARRNVRMQCSNPSGCRWDQGHLDSELVQEGPKLNTLQSLSQVQMG